MLLFFIFNLINHTAGSFISQCEISDFSKHFQETWQATPPQLLLTPCGSVGGAESKLDFKLLEFSQSMSPQDVAKQVITALPAVQCVRSACLCA